MIFLLQSLREISDFLSHLRHIMYLLKLLPHLKKSKKILEVLSLEGGSKASIHRKCRIRSKEREPEMYILRGYEKLT